MSTIIDISEQLLRQGIDVRLPTFGSSMFPIITTGDRITVSPSKNLSIGDIILFKRGDELVCHRLIKIYEEGGIKYYQTRGDSFFHLDFRVTHNQILGKVVKIEREHVSLPRKILLLIHPILKFSKVNAFIIVILVKLKAILQPPKSH